MFTLKTYISDIIVNKKNKIKCNRNTEPFNNIYFLIKDIKSVIRRGKLNDKQCNNQKETEQKDF
jgi:hypothetical protein